MKLSWVIRTLPIFLVVVGGAVAVTRMLWAETPYGALDGQLVMAENGNPLGGFKVTLMSTADYHWGYVQPWEAIAVTDKNGGFTFSHIKAGFYNLYTETYAHESPNHYIYINSGKREHTVFRLEPDDPFIRLYQTQRVFTTKEDVKLRVHGFVGQKTLMMQLFQVSQKTAVETWHGWLPAKWQYSAGRLTAEEVEKTPGLTPLPPRTLDISKHDIEGIFREEMHIGKMAPGAYLAVFSAGNTHQVGYLIITDLGMVVKMWGSHALAYTTDLITGSPRGGVEVAVWQETLQVGSGQTGDDGIATLSLKPEPRESEFTMVGHAGDDLAIANTYGNSGDEEDESRRVYTYTDRPVYRPGQTVDFKSIVRDLVATPGGPKTESADYRVPPVMPVKIRVTDGNDDIVYTGDTRTNAYGSLNGSFTLDDAAIPGWYTIAIELNGHTYDEGFTVAEYRKPEFEVNVTIDQPHESGTGGEKTRPYIRGENITGTITATYYYGAPVPGAKVDYYITRSPDWWGGDDYGEWDSDLMEQGGEGGVGDSYDQQDNSGGFDYGEEVLEGKSQLDDSGKLVLRWSSEAKMQQKTGREVEQEFMWSEDETYMDYRYTLHATVMETGNRTETGSADTLVTQGLFRLSGETDQYVVAPGETTGITITAADYDDAPQSGVQGMATLTHWTYTRDAKTVKTEEATVPWTTDEGGHASIKVTPQKSGDYSIKLTATDKDGHHISSSVDLWVQRGESEDFDYPYQDMQVRADKKLYHEGDTAKVLINTRFGPKADSAEAPQTALLTIEGAGVLQQRLITLKSKSTLLNIPITAALTPSAYVGVCFIKAKQMRSGTAVLNVSREHKAIKVAITPDKTTYLPGDTAQYQVKTTTPEGAPVAAEVSLGLVDEAIYAIKEESAEPIVSFFYPKRWNEVDTAFSFPDIYLSGDDKAGSKIKTRKNFLDTCFWEPSTVTGADGTAAFSVTLPDNLTTWRATCRAATLDTRVGEATNKVIVNKPFLVRLELPRFLTQDDRFNVVAIAHNISGSAVDADVGINAGGLNITGALVQHKHIEAGQTARFTWPARAAIVGNVVPRAWGKAGALEDAVQLTIPVIACGRTHVDVQSGAVTGAQSLVFQVPHDSYPAARTLTVRMAPSLVASMLGSLDYLASYPYGCVEQTMSCFLPDLYVLKMMDRMGPGDPKLRATVPKMVRSGLLKIYGFQQDDGGWGWYDANESNPWMTAYVLFGLHEAQEGGFEVNQGVMDRGTEALIRSVQRPQKIPDDTRAYCMYVLALLGKNDEAEKARGSGDWRLAIGDRYLSDWGRLTLARALHLLSTEGSQTDAGMKDDAEARSLLSGVWSGFSKDTWSPLQGEVNPYIGEARSQYWGANEDAAALMSATCEIEPGDGRLVDLAQWIGEHRRGGYWESTRATAATVYALSQYLATTQELQPDMDAVVTANGSEVFRYHFTAADLDAVDRTVTLKADNLPEGTVNLTLSKTGTGRLYYTAQLTQVENHDLFTLPTTDSGLSVSRSYAREEIGINGERDANERSEKMRTAYRVGDVVHITLIVRSAKDREYLMLEDPLPAGFEPQDRGTPERWEWEEYGWWWSAKMAYDQKTAFAIRHLNWDERQVDYQVVASTPGTFIALPPSVYDMYNSTVRAEGVATTITIRE